MVGQGEASDGQDTWERHAGGTGKCEASNARMLQPALRVGLFLFVCFEMSSSVAQASLKLAVQPRMPLDS